MGSVQRWLEGDLCISLDYFKHTKYPFVLYLITFLIINPEISPHSAERDQGVRIECAHLVVEEGGDVPERALVIAYISKHRLQNQSKISNIFLISTTFQYNHFKSKNHFM